MQRYNTISERTQGIIDQIAQQKEISFKQRLKNRRQPLKNDKFIKPDLHTIDISSIPEYSNNSQEKKRVAQSFGPCVGDYEISSPIVKPSYETYEKNDQVILVKINHFGGTSSFRNQGERFSDSNSIFQSNLSPGPGSYHFPTKSSNKKQNFSTSHHENYDIIQQLLRSNRERTESLPCYTLEAKKGWEYNGMPKHLQEMYQKIKEKHEQIPKKSLPLQKLIRLKKRSDRLPVLNNKQDEKKSLTPTNESRSSDKMTATLYRLQQDIRKQDERVLKIRQLLKLQSRNKNKDTLRTDSTKKKKNKEAVFAKNMINILYQIREK